MQRHGYIACHYCANKKEKEFHDKSLKITDQSLAIMEIKKIELCCKNDCCLLLMSPMR